MVFNKREEGYNVSELGNWNVAADYSKLKIMRPLYLCDVYENMAKFGYDSILEELINFYLSPDAIKITGFERLVNELLRLIKNSKFAMKVGGTKKDIEGYEKQLEKILLVIPALFKTITKVNNKNKMIKIEKEKYNKVLNIVLEIKSKINEPLNKNHLIFTDKEEFDPKKYKEQIMLDAVTKG